MNQYKTGDTVWTRKRGKGIITDHSHFTAQDRPFRVRFESDGSFRSPRLSSLYPSEDAMKKARWYVSEFTHSPRVATNKETSGWREMLEGLPRVTINMSDLVEIKATPIQPKFKVGDAVYYNGGNWAIRERYWSGKEHRYNISKPGISGDSLLLGISESGLRYWRQTTFHTRVVHDITTKEFNADRFNTQGFDMRKVKHIGNSHGSDIFIYNADTNHATILYGYKGDDI